MQPYRGPKKTILVRLLIIMLISILPTACKGGGDQVESTAPTVITFPSPFKGNFRESRFIGVRVKSEKSFSRMLTLDNGLKLVFKQSSLEKTRLSIYLINPPLFQSSLGSGAEKIILLYLKEWIEEEAGKQLGSEEAPEGLIFHNKDLSGLSFEFNHKYYNSMVAIAGAALNLPELNKERLETLLTEAKESFLQNMKEPEYMLDYRLTNYLFKFNRLSNHFEGNFISYSTLDSDKLIAHYRESFFAGRFTFLINGENIDESATTAPALSTLSTLKESRMKAGYEALPSDLFESSPRFYKAPESPESPVVTLKGFFNAPSFLNDDFFSFQVLLKIVEENLNNTQPEANSIRLSSVMLNNINYGEINILLPEGGTVYSLLSLKRELERTVSEIALYYYMDENDELIRGYSEQSEERLIREELTRTLPYLKREIYRDYNFTDIHLSSKEIKFSSTIFLLNDFADNSIIKARIDSITKSDLQRLAGRYLSTICWAITAGENELKSVSKDFLY